VPVSHASRTGKTYYLHTGPKRGGGVQYFFSTKAKGQLADKIPDGFEVYETVNGQVYLRRHEPPLIRPHELDCIRERIREPRGTHRYKMEARGAVLTIHESSQDFGFMREFNPFLSSAAIEETNEQFGHYQPILRFTLVDTERRLFAPERYCFRGSVDDWISIGKPDTLEKLAAKYLKHLGRDSFYELY
jgi:hypothetical protein